MCFFTGAVMIEVELIDGELFGEFGLTKAQRDAVEASSFDLYFEQVVDGFKGRPVVFSSHLHDLGQLVGDGF